MSMMIKGTNETKIVPANIAPKSVECSPAQSQRSCGKRLSSIFELEPAVPSAHSSRRIATSVVFARGQQDSPAHPQFKN
jgi:hypothetical protein